MLSRIAESMFWIGRYVERAEDTARILDVQTQLLLEDPGGRRGRHLPHPAVDHGRRRRRATPRRRPADVLELLAYDPTSPASIAAALAAARESARRARETLSTPMWEAMNTTYRAIPSGQFRAMRPPDRFRWVRDRAALINGTADATMTRDEGWQFLVLGRSIERADMTARLVATARRSRLGRRLGHHAAGVRRATRRSCAPTRASRPSAAPPSSCSSTGCSRARWSSA